MLVLSRRKGETIVITLPNGEAIEMTVTCIERGAVKFGFTAEKSIRIDRKEVVEVRRNLSDDPRFTPIRKSKD